MYLSVKSVKPLDGYKLLIRFENGEEKIFAVSPYLSIGKFAELKNLSLFNSIVVRFDTIEWANHLDIDPEFLYEKSVKIEDEHLTYKALNSSEWAKLTNLDFNGGWTKPCNNTGARELKSICALNQEKNNHEAPVQLNYIHKPLDTTAFYPNQLVPVEIKLKGLGGVFDLNVQSRAITSEQDIEKDIHDILKAIESLPFITRADMSDIRLMMDKLLEFWEGRWYYD